MKETLNSYLRLESGRLEGYERWQPIRLNKGVTIIGRPPISDSPDTEMIGIRINDDHISRGHIRIYYDYDEQRFILKERDTGTRNGTFINGHRIEPGKPYPLKDGDVLGLAKVNDEYRALFRFREEETTLPEFTALKESSGGELTLDLESRRVWLAGSEVVLRKKEFDLLSFLYQNHGKACSKDELAEKVWVEEGGIVSQETIDQNIHRIREKIEPEPSSPRYIITLPRYGYRLDL